MGGPRVASRKTDRKLFGKLVGCLRSGGDAGEASAAKAWGTRWIHLRAGDRSASFCSMLERLTSFSLSTERSAWSSFGCEYEATGLTTQMQTLRRNRSDKKD